MCYTTSEGFALMLHVLTVNLGEIKNMAIITLASPKGIRNSTAATGRSLDLLYV